MIPFRAKFFPPGIFSTTMAVLHRFGTLQLFTLQTYYQRGGVLEDRYEARKLIFFFDPANWTLTLRAQGAAADDKSPALRKLLTDALEETRRNVLNTFKGLYPKVPTREERGHLEFVVAQDQLWHLEQPAVVRFLFLSPPPPQIA